MMRRGNRKGQGHWTMIVGGLLAAIIIVVSIILLQRPAGAAKSVFECKGQGGMCADEITGNAGGKTCPEEAEGHQWVTLQPVCNKANVMYACCLKGPAVTPTLPKEGIPMAGETEISPEQQQREEWQESANIAAEQVTRGREREDETELLNGYTLARGVIEERFALFATTSNKDPDVATPLDYSSIKAFESVSIVTEYLRNREEITNPYGAMCKIWALMFRGYAEGYWSERDYGLDSFYAEVERRINQHAQDTQEQSYCQDILAIDSIDNLRTCQNGIQSQRLDQGIELPPRYQDFRDDTAQDCEAMSSLLQDGTLDANQPGFSVEVFFEELDAIVQASSNQAGGTP